MNDIYEKINELLKNIKNYELKSSILMPSADLRKNNIFNYCTNCIGFIYEDEKDNYKKYKNKFIYIDIKNKIFNNIKSIQSKRLWIQNYCILNNIEYAFMLDDDIQPFVRYNNKLIKLIDILKIIEIISFKNNLTLCTLNAHKNNTSKLIYYNQIYNTVGSMFINFKHLYENNIYFKNQAIHEDLAIWCDCLSKNLNVLGINNINFLFYYSIHPHLKLKENTIKLYPITKQFLMH